MDDAYSWLLLVFLTLVLLFGLVSALSDLVNDERTIVQSPERTVPKAALCTPPMTACARRLCGASERRCRGRVRSDIDTRIRHRRKRRCPIAWCRLR